MRHCFPVFTFFFNSVLETLATAIGEENTTKITKEAKSLILNFCRYYFKKKICKDDFNKRQKNCSAMHNKTISTGKYQ